MESKMCGKQKFADHFGYGVERLKHLHLAREQKILLSFAVSLVMHVKCEQSDTPDDLVSVCCLD
jgi:hypothetical protein